MRDALTLYKLIVLYMLSKVDFPLTKTQIYDFILGREYTNFLTLQKAIGELEEAGLIISQSVRNRTQLQITPEGLETLNFFRGRIIEEIRTDIDQFFHENKIEMRNEMSVYANYRKNPSGEYDAHLIAKDHGVDLVNITLSVPSEETAAAICDNWQTKNQDIYQYLIRQLF